MNPETASKWGPIALGLGLVGIPTSACLLFSPSLISALPFFLEPETAQARMEAWAMPLTGLIVVFELAGYACCFATWPLLMAGAALILIGRQRRRMDRIT